MRNTPSIATIACAVEWLRKRITDPEVGSSNPREYQQQQKKGKGKSEIIVGEGVSEEG